MQPEQQNPASSPAPVSTQPVAPAPTEPSSAEVVAGAQLPQYTQQENTAEIQPSVAAGIVAVEQTVQTDTGFDNFSENESIDQTELPAIEPITWQSIEYIQHDKSPAWYVGFATVTVVLIGLALWLGSWTFAVLIPVMAVALMVYTHRPARQLQYALSDKGLYINDQLHALGEFKSFGVADDGALHSLTLIPVKRFRPSLTVYFPLEAGENIVDFLGSYIPMQEVHLDVFDKIVRTLRI